MLWSHLICYIIIASITICYIVCLKTKKSKENKFSTAFVQFVWKYKMIILPVMLIICLTLYMEPLYYLEKLSMAHWIQRFPRAIIYSFYNSLSVFAFNGELSDVHSLNDAVLTFTRCELYSAFASVVATVGYILCPVVTIATILSFFKEFGFWYRYQTALKAKNIYIFSELNENSIRLAEDIYDKKERALIVFTDYFSQNEEGDYELLSRAKEIHALCTKKDITSQSWLSRSKIHKRNLKSYHFFLIGSDENENLTQTISLVEKYKNNDFAYESEKEDEKREVRIFLFSKSATSELAILNLIDSKTNLVVERIDAKRSLIYDYLLDDGDKIIRATGKKREFNILLLGMGEQGLEMLKALLWFCPMRGYTLKINVFDKAVDIENRFLDMCPYFTDDDFKNSVKFNDGVDFSTQAFYDDLAEKHKNANFVFVSTGNDDQNINISKKVRETFSNINKAQLDSLISVKDWQEAVDKFEKQVDLDNSIESSNKKTVVTEKLTEFVMQSISKSPIITTVVYNSKIKATIEKSNYRIDFIGDVNQKYSYKSIINTDLFDVCYKVHNGGAPSSSNDGKTSASYDKNKFNLEYNFRSTLAQVIYHTVWGRIIDESNGDTLKNWHKARETTKKLLQDEQSQELKEAVNAAIIECVFDEKARWNNYMKTEGVVYDDYSIEDVGYTKTTISINKPLNNVKKEYLHRHASLRTFSNEELEDEAGYLLPAYIQIVKGEQNL